MLDPEPRRALARRAIPPDPPHRPVNVLLRPIRGEFGRAEDRRDERFVGTPAPTPEPDQVRVRVIGGDHRLGVLSGQDLRRRPADQHYRGRKPPRNWKPDHVLAVRPVAEAYPRNAAAATPGRVGQRVKRGQGLAPVLREKRADLARRRERVVTASQQRDVRNPRIGQRRAVPGDFGIDDPPTRPSGRDSVEDRGIAAEGR